MANFHRNYLTITANEQDMRKVLRRFAGNLVANGSDFNLDNLSDEDNVQTLWRKLGFYLDSEYDLSFTADVTGSSSSMEYPTQIGNATLTVSIAPTGRYLSDTATVSMERYGNLWAFTTSYDTAWEPNYEDVSAFFEGLPAGQYGMSFFDADEYDGYETFTGYRASLNGNEEVSFEDGPDEEGRGLERIEKTATIASTKAKVSSDDLETLAWAVGACGFADVMRFEQDAYSDEEGEGGRFERIEPSQTLGFSFPATRADSAPSQLESPWGNSALGKDESLWGNSAAGKGERAWQAVLRALSCFPWSEQVSGSRYMGREANVECLVPGQMLKVVANWENDYFSPVALEVYTLDGKGIGNLGMQGGMAGYPNRDAERPGVALMLPHTRAYADVVRPRSAKDGNSLYSDVIVRLELTDAPLSGLKSEVLGLMEKPLSERGVSSCIEEEE